MKRPLLSKYYLSIIFVFVSTVVVFLSPIGLDEDLCGCELDTELSTSLEGRVMNGTKVDEKSLKWVASLFLTFEELSIDKEYSMNFKHFCTANAISSKWFLTASRCFDNLNGILEEGNITQYGLYVGIGLDHRLGNIYVNESYGKVKKYYTNPQPDEQSSTDLSLIELEEPGLKLGEQNVYPSCLLDFYVDYFDEFMFAGYGVTREFQDASVEQKIKVREEDDNLLVIDKIEQTDCEGNLICARTPKNTAVCHLDQGGGLMYSYHGRLYVTSLLIDPNLTCSSGSIVKYSPVFENLAWIDEYVDFDRCYTSNHLTRVAEFLFLIWLSVCSFLVALVLHLMSPHWIRKSTISAAAAAAAADSTTEMSNGNSSKTSKTTDDYS